MNGADDLVVDASVGAKLLLEEEGSAEAGAIFDGAAGARPRTLHVPDLFFAECANALRRAVQRRKMTPAEAAAEVDALAGLGVESTETRFLAAEALRIAVRARISVYDAVYVALSDRTGAPLVTADRELFDRLHGTRHRVRWLGG